MKTTIQIPDSLFEEARKLAAKEKTTLKALVEEGLRLVLAKRKQHTPFWAPKSVFQRKRVTA
jgi:hypothetical protein